MWNKNYKLRDIVKDVHKISMSMVIENEKISVDQLYKEIIEKVNAKRGSDRIQRIDTLI